MNVPYLFASISGKSGPSELEYVWTQARPEAKIIIPHLGSSNDPFMNDRFISLCRRHPNVWLDSSYVFSPWKIRDAVRCCGAEKILFGDLKNGGTVIGPPKAEPGAIGF